VEDNVYDWHLLHSGKGWEPSSSGSNLLAQAHGAPRPRAERHRPSQQHLSTTGLPSPSPAVIAREPPKQRKVPNVLIPGVNAAGGGSFTPSSAAANVGVPVPSTPAPRGAVQIQAQTPHPYANSTGVVQDYTRVGDGAMEESLAAGYGQRGSAATPAVSTAVRAREDIGGHEQFDNQDPPRRGFFASLCHCG